MPKIYNISKRLAGWGWLEDEEHEHWYRLGTMWPACRGDAAFLGEVHAQVQGIQGEQCPACLDHFKAHLDAIRDRERHNMVDRQLKRSEGGLSASRRYLPRGGRGGN